MENSDNEKENKPNQIEKNILEQGIYQIVGPDSGEIELDKIELKSSSGNSRIWKVDSFSEKEIVLKIEKFG